MDQNESDEGKINYTVLIKQLRKETVNNLRLAKNNEAALIDAISKYVQTGYELRMSSEELVDYFCVSTPSLLDLAGFTEQEIDNAVVIYDEVNPRIFEYLYPNCK